MRSSNKKSASSGKSKVAILKVTEPAELMKFLIAQLPGKSRNTIKSLLLHKQVLVREKAVSQYNYPLEAGQEVVIYWGKKPELDRYRELRIVFEDEHIIVIEKQSGLLSIATNKGAEQTAYSILSDHVKKENPKNRIFVVHRIDRETSGLMMFAKNQEIQQVLQENWTEAILERKYIVVVEGNVQRDSGTIKSWLKESIALIMYSSPIPNGGQEAITHYRVLRRNDQYSLLEAELETGRKNQIRVHMQHIGHCIIGDKKYGGGPSPINRIGLHAYVLSFKHPITGEEKVFETAIPKKFLSLFQE